MISPSAVLDQTDDHQVSVVGGRLRRHPLLESFCCSENLPRLTYQRHPQWFRWFFPSVLLWQFGQSGFHVRLVEFSNDGTSATSDQFHHRPDESPACFHLPQRHWHKSEWWHFFNSLGPKCQQWSGHEWQPLLLLSKSGSSWMNRVTELHPHRYRQVQLQGLV